jgi:hypothetical protein
MNIQQTGHDSSMSAQIAPNHQIRAPSSQSYIAQLVPAAPHSGSGNRLHTGWHIPCTLQAAIHLAECHPIELGGPSFCSLTANGWVIRAPREPSCSFAKGKFVRRVQQVPRVLAAFISPETIEVERSVASPILRGTLGVIRTVNYPRAPIPRARTINAY